jgi:DNA-binding IclR family transcriptional regulator
MSGKVVKSAARVLQVLELFDEERRPMAVSEVAAHHEWPASSTSALMSSLVSMGYLEYEPRKRVYRPSVRVALLGNWIHGNLLREGQLTRLMEHINEATGETIVLAAQNGVQSQYLRVLQGTNALRLHLHIGTVRPMFGSGTGSMLLSTMSDDAVRKLARRFNASCAPASRVNVDDVLAGIALDRAQGYAMSLDQVTMHSGLIAMLLPTEPGEQPLVLGISGLTARLKEHEQKYVRLMRKGMKDMLDLEPNHPLNPKLHA